MPKHAIENQTAPPTPPPDGGQANGSPVLAALAEVERLGRIDPTPRRAPRAPVAPSADPFGIDAPLELLSVKVERQREEADRAAEPVLAGFDRLVGLTSYGLLLASPLLFGAPALASLVLAYAHRRSLHPAARTHFRFQLRIVFTTLLLLGLAAAALIAAASRLPVNMIQFAHDAAPGLRTLLSQARIDAWTPVLGSVVTASAILFFALALVWLVGAALFGFIRLLADRPVGRRVGL